MTVLSVVLIVMIFLILAAFAVLFIFYRRRMQKLAAFQMASLIERHYGEIKNIYTNMRGWRHDFHNHLQTSKGYLSLNQHRQLAEYLDELEQDLTTVDTTVKSGNITMDAILNSKISLAESRDIKVVVKAMCSENMTVKDIDLCVVLGNLLDNAIDANELIKDENQRFIRIYVGRLKEQLYIHVTNATAESVKNMSGIYEIKKDKATHGNGLKRIDGVVEKYDGYLNRQNEPGVFATEILLPL